MRNMQKYIIGDYVTHIIYGDGIVVNTTCLGTSNLYKVKFDEPKETFRMFNCCDEKDIEQISKKL
jgi:hypothetical protein